MICLFARWPNSGKTLMTTLVTGDIHLSGNPRDYYRIETMRRLASLAKEWGVNNTIILGDLTEQKDRHNAWLVNQVVNVISLFHALGPVYVLQGNHDYLSDADCPFFGFIDHIPDVTWIKSPSRFDFSFGKALFLPHTRNYKRDWADLSHEHYKWAFAHNTFAGAQGDNGQKLEGIPIDVLPNNACVISGDVHVPQTICNLTYVGAPYTIDFGDKYEPRVLLIHDDGFESKPLGGPQKRLIDLEWSTDWQFFDDSKYHPCDIVKIRQKIPKSAIPKWPEIREQLRNTFRNMCTIDSITPVLLDDSKERTKLKRRDAKSDAQIMDEFAQAKNMDKATKKVGEGLL